MHHVTAATPTARLTVSELDRDRCVIPSSRLISHPRLPLQRDQADKDPNQDFDSLDGDVAEALAVWQAECQQAREIVANAASLDETGIQRSSGMPISLRRITVHMIAEYARHNGHADLLRERIDGATGY
jgi:hypothetical protein